MIKRFENVKKHDFVQRFLVSVFQYKNFCCPFFKDNFTNVQNLFPHIVQLWCCIIIIIIIILYCLGVASSLSLLFCIVSERIEKKSNTILLTLSLMVWFQLLIFWYCTFLVSHYHYHYYFVLSQNSLIPYLWPWCWNSPFICSNKDWKLKIQIKKRDEPGKLKVVKNVRGSDSIPGACIIKLFMVVINSVVQ